MNKINPPIHDDALAIQEIAENEQLGSHPHLLRAVNKLQTGYQQYESVGGNVFSVSSVALKHNQIDYLKGHYKSPPSTLNFINTLRNDNEHLICPMCGSMHSGTLDHVLPQVDFPEFSIYSRNLVPACKCNSKRQNIVRGAILGERILHPYFDICLSDRLIVSDFSNLGSTPTISLQVVVPNTHPEYAAIVFHVETIVVRTAIGNYFHKLWADLCRKPGLVVGALETRNPTTANELQEILESELDRRDDFHGGKNNWNSVFVAGLLNQAVLTLLFQQLTRLGRNLNDPLF